MAGSPTYRGLLWLTGGVLATVATAVVNELTNNLAIALLVGMASAVAVGTSINPAIAALENMTKQTRQSVGTTRRPTLVHDSSHPGEADYRRDHRPGFPLQQNQHNPSGERA